MTGRDLLPPLQPLQPERPISTGLHQLNSSNNWLQCQQDAKGGEESNLKNNFFLKMKENSQYASQLVWVSAKVRTRVRVMARARDSAEANYLLGHSIPFLVASLAPFKFLSLCFVA